MKSLNYKCKRGAVALFSVATAILTGRVAPTSAPTAAPTALIPTLVRVYFELQYEDLADRPGFVADLRRTLDRADFGPLGVIALSSGDQGFLSALIPMLVPSQGSVLASAVNNGTVVINHRNSTYTALRQEPYVPEVDGGINSESTTSSDSEGMSKYYSWYSNLWYSIPAGCVVLALLFMLFALVRSKLRPRAQPVKSIDTSMTTTASVSAQIMSQGSTSDDTLASLHTSTQPSALSNPALRGPQLAFQPAIPPPPPLPPVPETQTTMPLPLQLLMQPKSEGEESFMFTSSSRPKPHIQQAAWAPVPPTGSFQSQAEEIINARRQLGLALLDDEDSLSLDSRDRMWTDL